MLNKVAFQSKAEHQRMVCISLRYTPVTLTLSRRPWCTNLT